MSVRGRTIGIFTTILCLMVVFSLLFLPWMLVTIFGTAGDPKPKPEKKQLPSHFVEVYRTDQGGTQTIELEEYVKGVVAGEMPSDFQEEALKAQAVAARTYAVSKILSWQNGKISEVHKATPLCDSTHCQVYRTPQELEKLKSAQWMESGWKKIERAVEATSGQVLYYEGRLADQPLFHSSSGGKTENSEAVFASAVPYLRSVSSPYEEGASHQQERKTFSAGEMARLLAKSFPGKRVGTVTASTIAVQARSQGGRVDKIKIGEGIFTGSQVRQALGLASANFTVGMDGATATFVTNGYGHGVGMSQYGANGMAAKGADYQEILKHYYSGVTVEPMKQ